MKRIISALALLTVVSVGAAGCSDDKKSTTTTTTTGGKGNTAGTSSNAGSPAAGDGNTPTGGASSGNVMCDPTQNGVCQNDTDCPSVASGDARLAAGTCGQGCLGSADKNCAVDCIVMKTDMTPDCATCYAGAVACATMNCLAQCIQDPEAADCKACQVEKGCRADFNDCSGLPE
ncbi:MAG TPA: hypothetical protein VNG33_03020 [Polyangiaceae bacterium]|nr:hypothetical protein [Polyangiaceae bacterium]